MEVKIDINVEIKDSMGTPWKLCSIKIEAKKDKNHSANEAFDETFAQAKDLLKIALQTEKGANP